MWEIRSCQKSDECFPKILRNIKAAPDILYYVGDISACENSVIAVVGKRDATDRYLKLAKRIGEILAREGYTVLNGLAVGVDAYASEGAVDAEKDGGTMHTADYAVKYAKPLGCFVESAGMKSPVGNQMLIDSRKASAIQDTEALIDFAGQPDYVQMSLFV